MRQTETNGGGKMNNTDRLESQLSIIKTDRAASKASTKRALDIAESVIGGILCDNLNVDDDRDMQSALNKIRTLRNRLSQELREGR